MPLTPSEKRKNRLKTHKQYNTYIPLYIANPFDEKLKNNKLNFTDWLKESMEKYLKKN